MGDKNSKPLSPQQRDHACLSSIKYRPFDNVDQITACILNRDVAPELKGEEKSKAIKRCEEALLTSWKVGADNAIQKCMTYSYWMKPMETETQK